MAMSLPESSNTTIPTWKGSTSGSTTSTGRLVDVHALQHGFSILCLDAENAYFHTEEDEEVYYRLPLERINRYHTRSRRVENPRWKLKRQLYGRRKAAKKFIQFVVTATDGFGLEQCPEEPSLFRRPGTTLIFELRQDDFYVSGSNVELAWLQEHLGARLKLELVTTGIPRMRGHSQTPLASPSRRHFRSPRS